MEGQVQMINVKNTGRMRWGRRFLWGILLGAVCLLSACGKREAVFVAGKEAAGRAVPPEASGTESAPGLGSKKESGNQGLGEANGSAGETHGAKEDARQELVVYVCGQVCDPGVYTLPEGSRIADAVELAGGMTEEAAGDALNLAELLADAQMIRIPSVEEVQELGTAYVLQSMGNGTGSGQGGAQTGTEPGSAGTDSQGRVSLNQATREQLLSLPGIGESKADAILLYRQENGGFQTVEEIMNISGIKEGVFLKIKDKIMI